MTSDNGPLGGCRGRAGVPMFGNVVFGGIKGKPSALLMSVNVSSSHY